MPQMAPLSWELLFFTFILSFLLMSIIIYHNPQIINKGESMKINSIKQSTWKW